jgi:hypothetical protein
MIFLLLVKRNGIATRFRLSVTRQCSNAPYLHFTSQNLPKH